MFHNGSEYSARTHNIHPDIALGRRVNLCRYCEDLANPAYLFKAHSP